MRRSALSTAVATVAALTLVAGCGTSDSGEEPAPGDATPAPTDGSGIDPAEEPDEASIAALEAVTVDWTPGEVPELIVQSPFEVNAPLARLVADGDGEELAAGDIVTINYITIGGLDGTQYESSYDAEAQIIVLGDDSLWPALNELLVGAHEGAQVLFATPYTEESLIMAIEVESTVPARAEGEAVAPADGLPTVTLGEDGRPEISALDTDPPADLVVQPLIEGDGPVVEDGQNVLFQYSGWLWDGEPFDSSWDRPTPFSTQLGVGQVIQGWDQGLVGQKVGSQVLLVIPAELGYGENGQGSIPGGATLVFVVDILHAS